MSRDAPGAAHRAAVSRSSSSRCPPLPLVRAGYLAYFRFVLPRIGKLVSRHNAAYDYLPASVAAFETPDELVKILRQSGFTDIRAVPLTLGVVYLYTAA